MKRAKEFLFTLVCFATLSLALASCNDATPPNIGGGGSSGGGGGDGGNGVPKTLVVSNIPHSATLTHLGENYCSLGIFPVGTTSQQALGWIGIVAGSGPGSYITYTDPFTYFVNLYPMNGNSPWTGSGIFDIYLLFELTNKSGSRGYRARSVNISTSTTTIPFSNFQEIFY